MSKAAKNLVLLVYCKSNGMAAWTVDAEDTLKLIAANLIAGNY